MVSDHDHIIDDNQNSIKGLKIAQRVNKTSKELWDW